jgi:hypothetical protein
MTYFVSTPMGFITNNTINHEFPKRCIDQARSRDVRWAHPFGSWMEANRFATELTSGKSWPPAARYFAILTSASPNLHEDEPPVATIVETPAKRGLGDRFRDMLSPSHRQSLNLSE